MGVSTPSLLLLYYSQAFFKNWWVTVHCQEINMKELLMWKEHYNILESENKEEIQNISWPSPSLINIIPGAS